MVLIEIDSEWSYKQAKTLSSHAHARAYENVRALFQKDMIKSRQVSAAYCPLNIANPPPQNLKERGLNN